MQNYANGENLESIYIVYCCIVIGLSQSHHNVIAHKMGRHIVLALLSVCLSVCQSVCLIYCCILIGLSQSPHFCLNRAATVAGLATSVST